MLRPFSQMEEVEVVTALVSPLLALRIKILHLAIRIRKLHLSICIFSCWVRIAIVLLLFLASAAIQPKPFPLYSHFVLLAEQPVEVEFCSVIICLVLAMAVGSEEIFAIFGSYERFLWLMHIVSVVCVAVKSCERNFLRYPTQSQFLKIDSEKEDETDEKDENALIMETVREESDNLTAYLAKLREVIRAEEHIPLQITSFDIHAALLNLVAVYRKNRQKEVNVSLDYQRTSDLMMGDRDQLLNVVSNLMENSVKYSGDIVNIHVACRDTGKREVMISVSDNGIGISPDEQQRVWTKFYRSNTYPDMMQPGIGLGLSFVDMIVKAHGGRKMMQSEVGKGTRISIVIPQHS